MMLEKNISSYNSSQLFLQSLSVEYRNFGRITQTIAHIGETSECWFSHASRAKIERGKYLFCLRSVISFAFKKLHTAMPTNTQNTQTRTPDFFLPLENKSRQSKIGSCPPTNIKHTNVYVCVLLLQQIFYRCVYAKHTHIDENNEFIFSYMYDSIEVIRIAAWALSRFRFGA